MALPQNTRVYMKNKYVRDWQAVAIYMAAFLALFMFVYYYLTIRSEDMIFDSENVYEIDGDWQTEAGGRTQTVTLPAAVEAEAGETVIFRKVLEDKGGFCNTLLFHSSHQYIRVYLDGELLHEYGFRQDTPFKMSPGSPWQCVRLPEGWAGRELTIVTSAYYDHTAGVMEAVYLGTKNALVFKVFKDAALALMLIAPVGIAGVLMVIISLFFKQKSAVRKLRYIGFFAIITSFWILLESRMIQLVTGNILVCMNLIFILFALIPVFISYYLMSYPIFHDSRYMNIIYGVSVVNFLLIQFLRVSGLVDYMTSVSWVHVVLALQVGGIVAIFIREKRRKAPLEKEIKSLFFAVFVFAGFGLADVVRFYGRPDTGIAVVFTKIGLFCFVLILGYSAIRQESAEQEKMIEQMMLEKLAFTDMLTGLKNRTAFEELMDRYRQGTAKGRPIVMVSDMNGLKNINDTYGHCAGDKAIIRMAGVLEECFGKRAECFRIGGDEFCVISEQHTEEDFSACMERYLRAVQELNIDAGCGISAAGGFVRCGSEGIDKAFIEADRRMYECKARMKSEEKAAGGSE